MVTPSEALATLRDEKPLVQCITNFVSMNFAANALLAAGASPAMVHNEFEAGEFATIAGALSVNVGTLEPNWVPGMKAAIEAANRTKKPWVLDPVAHFATPHRGQVTMELLAMGPTILRGNASEILSLDGGESMGRGVDAGDEVSEAVAHAIRLADKTGSVVAVTGQKDLVTDGVRIVEVHGGSQMMTQVTAMGCALSCLCAGYASVLDDAFEATVAALTHFSEAGARVEAEGPGSFAWKFLDQLAVLTAAQINDARVQPL